MAQIRHCDNCSLIMTPGEWALRLCMSEFLVPKPGRPRMQYMPGGRSGASNSEPLGLFEVDIELCESCVKKPLDFGALFDKMTAGIERKPLAY